MDPRFANYAIASHWPYLDAHLEITRSPAVRRALWLLAQLTVDIDGSPVLLGRARLRELGITPGEAEHVLSTLADAERRRAVVRHPGSGRRPAAWSFRGPLEHWRGFLWRAVGARTLSDTVLGCARSRFCEGRCDFASEMPGQKGYRSAQIILGTPSHLFPSGQTLVDFRRKVASPDAKSRRPVDFVPGDPVDFRHNADLLAPTTPSSLVSSIEETSVSLDRQHRIDALQRAFRAAGGGEIFTASRRYPELVALAGALTDAQCAVVAREVARANDQREHKWKAPLLLDHARALAKAPAVAMLADVAPEG